MRFPWTPSWGLPGKKDTLTFLKYRWTWIWQIHWDQENWSVICKIRRIHIYMTNTWYASDWDQACRPSYAKICRTVVRHIQVHLYWALLSESWLRPWLGSWIILCRFYATEPRPYVHRKLVTAIFKYLTGDDPSHCTFDCRPLIFQAFHPQ